MLKTPEPSPHLLGNHSICLVLTFLALLFALAAYFAAPPMVPPPVVDVLPYYFRFDSSGQRLAHKALLCALAVLGLFSPWARAALGRLLGPVRTASMNALASSMYSLPLALALLFIPVFLYAHRSVGKDQFLLGLAISAGVMLFGGRLAQSRPIRLFFRLGLGLYLAGLLLLGFVGTFSFGANLQHSLFHYYAVLGITPIMATGGTPLVNSIYFYGLLPQTLLAIYEKHVSFMSIGGYVLVIQSSLVLFTLLALLCYRRLAPSQKLWPLLCVALWLPWMIQVGADGTTPPNSGLRFMGFPLGVLALLWAERFALRPQALLLGAMAGVALLLNMETGICVLLGYCAYSIVSQPAGRLKALASRLGLLFAGCLAVMTVYALVFRLGLGRWPLAPTDILAYIRLFASGTAGIVWEFDILALFICVYPAYLVLRLTGVWLKAELSARMRFKFAIGFIILLWFAYYANRAWDYSLYSHAFLFTCLGIDLLPAPLRLLNGWQGFAALGRRRVPTLFFLLIFILGPSTMNYALTGAKIIWRSTSKRLAYENKAAGMETFSGIWLEADEAKKVRAQCRFLAQIPKDKRIFFADANQFLLQVESRRFFPLSMQDIFNESFTTKTLADNIAAVAAYGPELVLLGDSPLREGFNQYLMEQLRPAYVQTAKADGWLVLEQRKAAP